MTIKFSEEFHIDTVAIKQFGFFDIVLDIDTRVFIDPALLKHCTVPEFSNASKKVTQFFSDIICLLQHSNHENDLCWKEADKRLTFHELTGTCIGYSEHGTSGKAIGPVLRTNILKTVKTILNLGECNPRLFELLGVFQNNFGCDRISDLMTFILREEIYMYTSRVCTECGIDNTTIYLDNKHYRTCINPYSEKPLLLLPQDILTPLPIAEAFNDLTTICQENQRVRDEINSYFDFGKRNILEKQELLQLIHAFPDFRKTMFDNYVNYPAHPYDFTKDPSGEYRWYDVAKSFVQRYPAHISPAVFSNESDVLSVTQQLCMHFKDLVENNGLSAQFYNDDGKPRKESTAQLLFFAVSSFCCEINNIDLSRETNNGRGPVDFKLSRGSADKVLVEVKLTSNKKLKHGIASQLPIYMAQENVQKAIYLIEDTGYPKALKNFEDYYQSLSSETKNKITYYVIDATQKPSASKA